MILSINVQEGRNIGELQNALASIGAQFVIPLQHTLYFSGAITQQSVHNIRSIVLDAIKQNASSIKLVFSSEGGDLNAGLSLYHFLRALPIPLTIHNFGTIESIAVLIYMAADTRLVTDDAWFLVHSFNAYFYSNNIDYPRLSERTQSLGQYADVYTKIINERTKGAKSPLDISKVLNGEAIIVDASTATNAGIATSITPTTGVVSNSEVNWYVNP